MKNIYITTQQNHIISGLRYVKHFKKVTVTTCGGAIYFGCGVGFSFYGKDLMRKIKEKNNKAKFVRFYASSTSFYDPFTAPIPSSYIIKSNKPFIVILRMSDLDTFNTFSSKIENSIPINTPYIVFIKLRYFSDSFCMCGKQFGFDYKGQDQIL